ncbi:Uncharacterised protein [Paraprevotella clara]|uniref:Uncharacterized protein n=1 Tax=Paraprevotella clara TaxID=454154 RepID=A0A6N3CKF6_9BACT
MITYWMELSRFLLTVFPRVLKQSYKGTPTATSATGTL